MSALNAPIVEELPEELPEPPEVRLVRAIAEALQQQTDPENTQPLDPAVAEVLLRGFVSWARGGTWEQGIGLVPSKGRDARRSFWTGLRDRCLAEALALLDTPAEASLTARCKALIRALRSYEAGRYRTWKTAGLRQPPPEASALQHAMHRALGNAERAGGWPRSPARMLEAVRRGAVSLLDDEG